MGPPITSASGKPIPCWGWRELLVDFGGQQFRWQFLLAAVAFPLLGADFLAAFSLIVDLKQFVVYRRGSQKIQLEAPPAGSAFALVGVRPAAAAAAGQQSSSSSALHLHSSSGTGSSTASAHLSSPADAGRLLPVGDGPPAGQPAAAVLAAVAPAYQQLLQRFPDVLSPTKDLPPVKH
jgi:hypothetical protein